MALLVVGVVFPGSASAVGRGAARTVTGRSVVLDAVAAIPGTQSAWAVGNANGPSPGPTYIVRWTGGAWSKVASPNPGGSKCQLLGVTATSASDAWAVGACSKVIALHWNGSTWTSVPIQVPNLANIDAVDAVSASDVWAVGDYFSQQTSGFRTLVMHWNGSAWRRVASPSPNPAGGDNDLLAVDASSATNAWATGTYYSASKGADVTLALHWNGSHWNTVPTPTPGSGSQLNGVTVASDTRAWAVGKTTSGLTSTVLALRWNGTRWAQVALPAVSGPQALYAVAIDHRTRTSGPSAPRVRPRTRSRSTGTGPRGTGRPARTPTPPTTTCSTECAEASSHSVWAVGELRRERVRPPAYAILLHWKGTAWVKQ